MKTINIEFLSERQKQSFFESFCKERGGGIFIGDKTIGISTLTKRYVYFDFHENYRPLLGGEEMSWSDINSIVSSFYVKKKSYDESGFLESRWGQECLKWILQLNFGYWGKSVSFGWIEEEEENTDSTFYTTCICDLLGINYVHYKKCEKIINCGVLKNPFNG